MVVALKGKNPSVLTPPQSINKQDNKGGTNDNTHDSHTRETGLSRSYDDSLARNLDAENTNTEDDEYNDHPSIKNILLILNDMKNQKKTIVYFFFIESNRFGFV